MKKLIILLTILISTIFSNVAFADMMVSPSESKINIITDILFPIGMFLFTIIITFTIKGIFSFFLSKITFFNKINKNFVKIYLSSSTILVISIFITLAKTFGDFIRFDNSTPLIYGFGISIFLIFLTESFLFNKILKLKYSKSLIYAFVSNLLLIILFFGILYFLNSRTDLVKFIFI